MRSRRAQFAKRALCTTILSGFLTSQILPVAVAGPSGGVVVGGQGLITQSGLLTQIDQSSHRLIIEWDSFDTSTQETVRFFQPNRDAMALNRVLSGQATQFNGSLFANGNVVIVNGAGIHFGPNSQVDVGGLIASTADISNSNFLSGDLIFDQPGNPDAMVTNAGTITARDAGLAALVAPGVENSGLIRAELGTVVLGAGETHTIDFRGDGLISFALTSPTTTVPRRADGSEADALVTNSGTVEADGGSVVMTASQASRVLDTAINMSGVAQANSVGVRNGRIVLGGGGAGRVRLPGQVRARGTSAGTTGGTVHVTGQEISTESAQIDASGVDGGGNVLVGGAERGQTLEPSGDIGYLNEEDALTVFLGDNAAAAGDGFMPLASRTTVDAASFFDASSSAGDGGDVVVWGADEVNFHGTISTLGGDNGFVEVSTLGTGIIDGLAHTGHFLVDPGDVCVTTGATSACASGATVIASGTILDRLNNGSTFELNTDNYGMSGTGRVDFVGGFTFTINNDTNTMGTFLIHAADTIDTRQIVINNRGTNGTNFEWYAGTGSTGSQVSSADIIHGPQVLETGGGYVIFDAADDISINDPLDTSGGDVLLIARGGDGGSTISIGDTGSPDDDSIDTTDGAGNAGTVTLVADNFVIDAAATSNPIINAGGTGGLVEFRPFTAGTPINLGTITPNSLSLTDAQIDRIAAETLRFGDANSGDITISTAISPAQATNLSLVTGGNIIDGNATGTDITATGLALRSAGGISPLTTEVSNLAFSNTSGAFSVNNTGNMAVTEVDGLVSSTNTGTTTTLASSGTLSFLTDVTSAGALTADASTIELDGNLTAPGGITGTATVVNVLGSNGGAEIQDAVDIAVAGATINVGDGAFVGGISINKALTLLGDGFTNTTTVNVADGTAGMTVLSSNVSIDGFLFEGDGMPVDATGVLVDGSGGALTNVLIGDADADLAGNRFTGLTTGLQVTDGVSTNAIDLEIGRGNVFDASTDGIVLDGSGVGLTGNTFSDASFAADISGDYIRLEDGAAFLPDSPTVLDARGATFDGVLGSDLTAAEAIAVEEALVHYLDDQTLGLIRTGPLAVTSGNSIQIAVNVAGLLGGPQTVAVGSGTFGGSVEVWVDDLTLVGQGTTTIIDTDAVDPFANNGDVNNGFQVAAIDATGTNPTDPSGAGNVTGVTIEGFAFTDGAPSGENIGIELGAPGFGVSAAEDTTILNSSFTNLLDGIVAHNATGLTAISGVTMSGIAQHGVRFEGFPDGDDAFLVQQSSIESAGNAIRFAGFGTGYAASIDGNTLVSTGDSAVQFARGFNNADISIVDNDLIQGAQDGILFDDEQTSAAAFNGGSITIAGNFSILGEARDGIRISENLFNNDFTVGTANVTFLGSTTAYPGNGSIVGGERGIHVVRGLSGNDGVFRVANNGSIQGLGDDAIRFGASVLNGASVGIVGNSEVRGATDGIDLFSVTLSLASSNNRSSLLIAGNGGIYGEGATSDGVTVDVSVFQSDVTIGAGSFLVGDTDMAFGGNGEIIGGDAGIDIDRVVQTSTVSVLDNTLVQGGTDGLVFSDFIDNGVVAVSGNTAIEGDGDGIEFASTISGGSSITVSQNQRIEGLGTAPDEDDLGDGIVFRDAISGATTTVLIDDNDLIQGNDRGIAFTDSATVNDSSITISRNDEIRGTNIDGILFNNDLTDATIVIGGPAAMDGNGLIIGADEGLDVESVTGGSVTVANNTRIEGESGDAIEFEDAVRQATVSIASNLELVGGDSGIEFEDVVRNSEVSIASNPTIEGGDTGILFEDLVWNSDVTIDGNTSIQGLTEDGIAFEGPVRFNSDIQITDNTIEGAENGVIFLSGVTDSAVTIDDNDEIRGLGVDGISFFRTARSTIAITNNTGIFGDGFDGIFLEQNIIDSELTIEQNDTIIGQENGISLSAGGPLPNLIAGSSVSISDNGEISGTDADGIILGALLNVDDLTINSNEEIRGGGANGIAIFGAALSDINITENTGIYGDGSDGVLVFAGLAGTDFVTSENGEIVGSDDGMNLGFILGGSFAVDDNMLIRGVNGSGMEFEGPVVAISDFVVENNELIIGGEEAIEFDTPAAILGSTLRFTNNTMEAGTDGMLFDGFIGGSDILTEENTILADENGIRLTNFGGGSTFTVDQSDVTGGLGGLAVRGSAFGGGQSFLTLGETDFNGTLDAGISVTTRAGGSAITTAFEDGVVTTGFPSLAMSGPNQAIAGNTIANVAFNSVAGGNFIELSNGALFEPGRPTIILGTGASFDGTVVGSNAEQATINWVEGRIIDFDDNPTLGQIFFFYLPYLFDSGFGDGPVRTTNIQTPGDWILRPDFFFQILATNPLRDDYGLGTCVFEYSETEGRFLPRCINHAGPVDPSPAIQRTLEGMEELSALQ